MLYREKEYSFEVSVIGAEHFSPVLYSLVKEESEVELFSVKATVIDAELEVRSFEEGELQRARAYQVRFVTPTLLQIPHSTTTRHRDFEAIEAIATISWRRRGHHRRQPPQSPT